MPIAVQCPHCSKAYQVKDHLAGSTVRCTACQKPMSIPALTKPAAVAAGAPANPRGAKASAPNRQSSAPADYARFGLEGPIRRTADLFGPAPPPNAPDMLANHVVADPGFGSSVYVPPKKKELNLAYQRVEDDDEASTLATKSKLLAFGALLLVLGVVAIFLPLLGVDYKVIFFLSENHQWIGGIVMVLIGIVLVLYGSLGSKRKR